MSTTALLLIDNQLGFRDVTAWGTGASNPDFEKNVTALIAAFRDACAEKPEGQRPLIIHVQYRPVWTDHPLHVSKTPPPVLAEPKKDAASLPPPDEIIMTSHGHSVFINTPLESILKKRGIKTLLIAGMATDLAVSTAVRTAQNLALTGKWGGRGNMADAAASARWTDGTSVFVEAQEDAPEDERGEDGLAVEMARIILIGDATRAFGKAGVAAQTVHSVHVESLRDFAEVRSTAEVIGAFH
ncbi:Isochorismatase-like protein [Gamsiella multidivaricata]|uniref:Isochorismatase-like protein n=1 Tax=Gamsiella multidivaricata TaxID=101098 RepID=UPI00221F7CD2|nr:Isochorismatase-like protein [Gamsiella multidivaricata]KAI7832442.1 Isochorismatase-like protein [Gamsiella multidivaricata]